MNVLFITLDQFRGDSYGAAGHPLVRTPTLDRVAAEGVRLERHYSQAAPCAPGRAAIYTGMYQMNNRVVANGTPLSRGFDNLAYVARRAGYDPTLFGYTDQGLDPASANDSNDVRIDFYDGVLPGLSVGLYLPETQAGWVQFLRAKGYDVAGDWDDLLRGEPGRPADDSLSGFLTTRFLEWLEHQESGWFAHLSYLRPHPPYAAAGEFARLYDPADVSLPLAPVEKGRRHPLHEAALSWTQAAAPTDGDAMRSLTAQYCGMISEVDAQLGRVVGGIEQRGEWQDTLVVVTSDHGDQLGDHGLIQKLGFFPQSYHVIGLWRDPREVGGTSISNFTENVDLLPTLADALGVEVPVQCDGQSLDALFGDRDAPWRDAAHYEWDSRFMLLGASVVPPPSNQTLARRNLAVSVSDELAYVQFGDGSYRCFDLAADPTWRTECRDVDRVLHEAQRQLVWRQEHLRHDLTDMLLTPERLGHWPKNLRHQPLAEAVS
ncbi:MAG TPA: sulfatase-like hydrolase/transferase [Acidimicrobiales bacterium]|nr:sulfatase-like hydrolase/transferase [Acidimicrobiales bacterium]